LETICNSPFSGRFKIPEQQNEYFGWRIHGLEKSILRHACSWFLHKSSFQKSGTDRTPSESLCLHGNHLLGSGVGNFTLTYPSYTFRIFQV
jgi:hypothetical protein